MPEGKIMRYEICLLAVLALAIPATASAATFSSLPDGFFEAGVHAGLGGVLTFVLENMDWMALIWSVTKMAALSFVLSVIILFYCLRRRVFKRANTVWDKLTGLYYVLIPVVMLVASVGISVPAHVGTMAENLIVQGLVPILDGAMYKTVENLPENANVFLKTSPEEYFNKAMMGVLKEETASPSGNLVQRGALHAWEAIGAVSQSWLASLAATILTNRLAHAIGTDSDMLKTGIKAFYKEGILHSASGLGMVVGQMVVSKIKSMIHSVQLLLLLIPGALLLIPVLDTFIARRLEKRKETSGQ
jgi:hypothetical protein